MLSKISQTQEKKKFLSCGKSRFKKMETPKQKGDSLGKGRRAAGAGRELGGWSTEG